jgi:multicomponent Na+:H+ antiporter subunit C
MLALLAIAVGGLFAAGGYLLLRRSAVRLLIGLSLIGHAANLLILSASGPLNRPSPILVDDALGAQGSAVSADPLAQALILTAIVISFAVVAFAVVLTHRLNATAGAEDVDRLRTTDE